MQITRIIPDVPSFLANSLTVETWSILFLVLQALVIFLVVVIVAAVMIVYERRIHWQLRFVANRKKPHGPQAHPTDWWLDVFAIPKLRLRLPPNEISPLRIASQSSGRNDGGG